MNINVSLIGEAIVFGLFIWLTMKFIWPYVTKAMDERANKIAEGLAAGERGRKDLENAQVKATEILHAARDKGAEVVEVANQQAARVLEEARKESQAERQRQVEAARAEIQQELSRAKDALRAEVANIAVAAAGKIVEREIDPKAHKALLDELAQQIH
ncbi:MAG: F0F1 ATP synthase subunit B [Gammaproteobacteria bacterium]|nr:F0F1 ATP synthase subunit B [Gammaproteobacteria bacterium]MBU6509414.1 F0F1 ATP synthase subunit B [Gammaproteobacteria bacterium]MDE1983778.1 F0F1 ATP synthase subunit B [Gammaproteobacteria bacterium]MDE2107755.1 F0F1 ATP synthase subunit B [Gammaproteobacteria bacterium]MDE2460751.1 F0F1 ATP synthase subunit B [Gammaproteobacteria bacterium]